MILFSGFEGNEVTRAISNRIEAKCRIVSCSICIPRQMFNALKALGIKTEVSVCPYPLDNIVMGGSRHPDMIFVDVGDSD